jgi:hypothetical protein
MSKRALVLPVLLLALTFLASSCKVEPELFSILSGEGNISYNPAQNATFFSIRFWVKSVSDEQAKITGWRIVFKSGQDQLLEVNKSNHQAYAPFVIFQDLDKFGITFFILQSVNPYNPADSRPFAGKLFPAASPDKMDILLDITLLNGKTTTAEQTLQVWYSTVSQG